MRHLRLVLGVAILAAAPSATTAQSEQDCIDCLVSVNEMYFDCVDEVGYGSFCTNLWATVQQSCEVMCGPIPN